MSRDFQIMFYSCLDLTSQTTYKKISQTNLIGLSWYRINTNATNAVMTRPISNIISRCPVPVSPWRLRVCGCGTACYSCTPSECWGHCRSPLHDYQHKKDRKSLTIGSNPFSRWTDIWVIERREISALENILLQFSVSKICFWGTVQFTVYQM